MKIIVTGGMGFVGSHTVQFALARHHEVAVMDNESTGFTQVKGAIYFKGNITEIEFVSNVFREFKPEGIIHLAAQPSLQISILRPQYDSKINIIGTINVAKKAQDYGAKVVFASTSAVYDEEELGIYYEHSKIKPKNPYGCSKAAAENYIQILCNNWNILRYGNVFGPRQVPLGENQFIPRAIKYLLEELPDFKINGDGKQKRDFIPVDDIAMANLLAVESKINGIFNIGTGRGTDINTIYNLIQTAMGIKKDVLYGPAKPGELKTVILNSEKAQILGWKAKASFEDTIRDTTSWQIAEKRKNCKHCP